MIAERLCNNSGQNAASLNVAEQYVKAFSKLAKTNNTLIVSNDASDVAKMTAQVSHSKIQFKRNNLFHLFERLYKFFVHLKPPKWMEMRAIVPNQSLAERKTALSITAIMKVTKNKFKILLFLKD